MTRDDRPTISGPLRPRQRAFVWLALLIAAAVVVGALWGAVAP